MNKEKIKQFLKIRENQFLVFLMVFTIIIRLYYFIKLGNQPIWWDEGDYLSIAKVWALGLDKPEWWGLFTGMRPLFMPLVWAAMMKIGLNELTIRFFTLFLPSVLTVYLVYAVGKDLYHKKIGLIAGFIMSVYWVHLFYTFRLLTDIPALCLGMLTIYFFYSKYYLKGERKGLYWACFFGVLAFSARFPQAVILVMCFLFLLFTEKIKFFKNKMNWKALGLILLLLSPYLIYLVFSNFAVLSFYFGERSREVATQTPYFQAIKNIFFELLPSLFGPGISFIKNIFLIFLIIGIFNLYKFFIYFDIIYKQGTKKFNSDFFILLWLFLQTIIYVGIFRGANDRWLLMLMPALFFFVAKGFYSTFIYIKKYSVYLSVFVILILILLGGYYQLNHANNLIEIKKETYKEVMLAGLWLKENTPKDAKVITASIVQNEYYSERDTYGFSYFFGNESQETTKELFEKKVEEIKPDYLILNIVQRTPDWAYTYPQEKNLIPVKSYLATKEDSIMYGVSEGQPLLVIYKFQDQNG